MKFGLNLRLNKVKGSKHTGQTNHINTTPLPDIPISESAKPGHIPLSHFSYFNKCLPGMNPVPFSLM